MKNMLQALQLLFIFSLVFSLTSCSKHTETPSIPKKLYKIRVIENTARNITINPKLENLDEVEKDTEITFNVTVNNSLLHEIGSWSINGGTLREGGQKGDTQATVKISSDVTVGVNFEQIVLLTYPTKKFQSVQTIDGMPINSGDRLMFNSEIRFVAKHEKDKIIKNWNINGNKKEATEYLESFAYTPLKKDVIEENDRFVIDIDFEEKTPETFSLSFDSSKIITGTLNPLEPITSSPAQVKEGSHLVFWALVPNGKAVKNWKRNDEVLPLSERVIYYHFMSKDCKIEYEEKEAKKAKMIYNPEKIWCSFSRPNPPGATMFPVPKENTLYEGDLLSIKKNGGKEKCKFSINGIVVDSEDLIPPDGVFLLQAKHFKDGDILDLELDE